MEAYLQSILDSLERIEHLLEKIAIDIEAQTYVEADDDAP